MKWLVFLGISLVFFGCSEDQLGFRTEYVSKSGDRVDVFFDGTFSQSSTQFSTAKRFYDLRADYEVNGDEYSLTIKSNLPATSDHFEVDKYTVLKNGRALETDELIITNEFNLIKITIREKAGEVHLLGSITSGR